MKAKYKEREWLKGKLKNDEIPMAEIARQFDKDLTTIRYWRDKFNIEVNKNVKYPVKKYTCPVCRKEFEKRVTKDTQAVYCSQECAYKGRSLGITERNVEDGYDTEPTKVTLTCNFCGKEFQVDKTEDGRKYCSRECFLKQHRKDMKGENNPAWKGGTSYEKRSYRGDDWSEQRNKCYERDNYICQICGIKCIARSDMNDGQGGKLIQCHHMKEYKNGGKNSLDNLITLCASCHTKLHEGAIEFEVD